MLPVMIPRQDEMLEETHHFQEHVGSSGSQTSLGDQHRQVTLTPPMIQRPTVSVVIPALNEVDNLPYVLPRVPKWVDEVVLVDGHSTDDTIAVACTLCPQIRVITQEGCGKGAALRTGFAAAIGDIIVMLDADGSTDPVEIPVFVGALLAGADFAKGSRFLQGGGTADMPFYRKVGNWVFVCMVRLMFGGNYSDLCYGYNAFWRRVLPQLELTADGFEIEAMMNIRALQVQLKVAEVPSFEALRMYGSGRLRTIPDGWRVLKTIFAEWHKSYHAHMMARRQKERVPVDEAMNKMHNEVEDSILDEQEKQTV